MMSPGASGACRETQEGARRPAPRSSERIWRMSSGAGERRQPAGDTEVHWAPRHPASCVSGGGRRAMVGRLQVVRLRSSREGITIGPVRVDQRASFGKSLQNARANDVSHGGGFSLQVKVQSQPQRNADAREGLGESASRISAGCLRSLSDGPVQRPLNILP